MPRNEGGDPFYENENPPLVDIRYRNGLVVRGIKSAGRRWTPWPDGRPSAFDIVSWQVSAAKEYELVWPDQLEG